LRIEGVAWSAQRIPTAVNIGFKDRGNKERKLEKNNDYKTDEKGMKDIKAGRG
jgi:hypothetical protein